MTQINPYLVFNGNCEEAFTFYKNAFQTEFVMFSRFSDTPQNAQQMPESQANKIMHVSLPIGENLLMGSDSPLEEIAVGQNVSISINTTDRSETERIFKTLSEGGRVTMPLQDTFWGAYFAMLVDKFGIAWMLNCEEKK